MTNSELLSVATRTENDPATVAAFTDAVFEDGGEPGFCGHYPEMGEKPAPHHIRARLCHYGKHYTIDTPLTLKGRGITFKGVNTPESLCRGTDSPICGWNRYRVTVAALEALEKKYRVSHELLL